MWCSALVHPQPQCPSSPVFVPTLVQFNIDCGVSFARKSIRRNWIRKQLMLSNVSLWLLKISYIIGGFISTCFLLQYYCLWCPERAGEKMDSLVFSSRWIIRSVHCLPFVYIYRRIIHCNQIKKNNTVSQHWTSPVGGDSSLWPPYKNVLKRRGPIP